MNRRKLLILGSTTIALPLAARAQQKAMPLVGWLSSGAPFNRNSLSPADAGTIQGLADAGYVEGRNLAGAYRASDGHDDRLPTLAEELVGLNVDLIATRGNPSAALAAKHATATIPIVFFTGADPVAAGLVASFAHPGGNITGVTVISGDLNRKRLEFLTELVPSAKAIALLVNPHNARVEILVRDLQQAAQDKGLKVQIVRAGDQSELEPAIASLAQLQVDAMLVTADVLFVSYRQQLVDLVARSAVPTIYETRDSTVRGGLISYGTDTYAVGRRFGVYIGSVLKGGKPTDLPVEQPSKFQLVVNLKTAKTLGLTVPPSILARADEVIE